ncbi:SMP-30/gluconolactonase/LRE family protein [Massilia terrae]|uniref:SMP-30/gluconolactonase/LRE family protein n=1 Tax=Massilia terrae TaxID=1811224 RepID=A0ABT2CUW2_9BURK|nr:SMP-30/gluconolactonase/LRE family protein [Massilia terrae]MCS0657765.1 SMP-30/gluconolactonase/LRE family protein [Massilia terrae]
MLDVQHVGGVSCTVGESPLWNAADNAWYWSDIPARRVWRLDGSSGALRHWDTPEMVACLAPRAGGGWIAGMETGIFNLELKMDGSVAAERLAAPASLGPGMRFNDGRCDRQGRFWSGTMFMDMGAARAIGELYRYDAAHGLSAPLVSKLLTQNGLAWSPDGRTMYLSDSHPNSRTVWAFDYDIDSGTPHDQRVFADMRGWQGRPDGAAVDSDGCYWVAGNDGAVLLRFTPEGKLDREIALPVAKPSMCSFGGPGLEWLLVTSIRPGDAPADSLAGGVFLLRPGVRGVPETPFVG